MTTIQFRLPATSANLGPGFDTLAIALELFLEIEAARSDGFSIEATGRDHEACSGLENNLLLSTYRQTLVRERRPEIPIRIRMRNGIPIGMGCGSSAAARLAGVAMAAYFGQLGWDDRRIVEEAARLEGHPDNVAACWYGGMTIAAENPLTVVSIPPPADWRAILVVPDEPVSTTTSRSVLPQTYSRAQAVENIQNVALLTAAFTLGRSDLLALGTRDHLHQPYRSTLCPLLPALLPLAGQQGIFSVTLSGAGPAVLLLTGGDPGDTIAQARECTRSVGKVEIIETRLSREPVAVTESQGLW
jgi:homoserine kinase